MAEYYIVNWNTYEVVDGPINDLNKARRMCRSLGHDNDADKSRGILWNSPKCFVAIKDKDYDTAPAWGKWLIEYNPRFKAA